ncbi:hypothetical protein XENTR_v10017083 [Xenopus tropicalis]|nr:hypothetical protein XENTR_v10017083 [Xenopus tropicalis]
MVRQQQTTQLSKKSKTSKSKERKPKTCEYKDPRGILQLGYAIGEGANSFVCKGRYLENNETVAIKVMDAEKANNKEIKNEIKLLQKYTEHKNIATFRGVYLTPVPKGREKLWIAMEYCGGGNIAELISRTTYRAFPEPWIAYIIREVLRVCYFSPILDYSWNLYNVYILL